MTAIQSGKVDAFIARPPRNVQAVLIYGPDTGLVSERATALAASFAGRDTGALSVTRLTSGDLAEDPGRLADEATSMGLFGGRRVLRVRPESQSITNNLEPLLPRIDPELLVIVEAGQLAPAAGLRKLFEKNDQCAALPCYQDTDRDLERILDEHLRDAGIAIDADARAAFVARLGGDRLASRNEIEKLCLFARGCERITLADVESVSGDVSALALDDLCDAMGLGDLVRTDRITQRLIASGTHPDRIIAAAIRHLLLIHELRGKTDSGTRLADAVGGYRPPIFFKRKQVVQDQVRRWPLAALNRALDSLGEGERAARLGDTLAVAGVSRALLSVCNRAAALQRAAS